MKVSFLLEREKFIKKNNNLNGNFAIVEEMEYEIVLTCDIIRSIPLFYQVHEDTIYVSDYAEKIQKETKVVLARLNVNEFLRTGYVTEDETIFENIYQVLPGQQVHISKIDGRITKDSYFELLYTCDSKKNEKELIQELDETLIEVFQDLVERLNGRTALLPLSGGCDSRIVAVMLKRLGYENVICFSYGAKDNFEAKRSKEISDYLGYRWHFVQYTPQKWKAYYASNVYTDFLKYATRGSGAACIQASIAIMELKENELVPMDAVVIPGHTLDVLAGSHLPLLDSAEVYDKQFFVDEMLKQHYMLCQHVEVDTVKWSSMLPKKMSAIGFVQNAFKWEWKNRQAKFIANDVRAYEYVGFAWDLPLWDMRLCKFWMKVPYSYLYQRKLQYLYMESEIDPVAGIKEQYKYDVMELPQRDAIGIKEIYKKMFPHFAGIRGCLIQYHGTSNCFYNHYSLLEYIGLIIKYGAQFNLNSIVADKYILIVKKEIEKE